MAEIQVTVGRAYETMPPERRQDAQSLAAALTDIGYDVDLQIIEYVPGRRGLGPLETTAIAILASVSTKVFDKAIEDAYEVAKQWCRNRFRRKVEEGGGGRGVGFVLYGPDGEVLKQWSTQEDSAPVAKPE